MHEAEVSRGSTPFATATMHAPKFWVALALCTALSQAHGAYAETSVKDSLLGSVRSSLGLVWQSATGLSDRLTAPPSWVDKVADAEYELADRIKSALGEDTPEWMMKGMEIIDDIKCTC